MAHGHSSGFFFDVEKWKGSRPAQRMSFAQRGVYLEMLFEQWETRTLPNTPEAVADQIATSDEMRAEIIAAWPAVRRNFVDDERHPGRIYNARLERTRRQQRANLQKRQNAGRIGGEASARKRAKDKPVIVNQSLTTVQHPSTDKTRQEVDLIRPDLTSLDQTGQVAVNARSRRPIFSGQKITVFDWQLDDCRQTLGQFTDDFDLHEWFFSLDKLAYDSNLVVPKKDGGVWLQARLVEEAHRRGLPLVISAGPNKQIAAIQSMGREFLTNDGRR